MSLAGFRVVWFCRGPWRDLIIDGTLSQRLVCPLPVDPQRNQQERMQEYSQSQFLLQHKPFQAEFQRSLREVHNHSSCSKINSSILNVSSSSCSSSLIGRRRWARHRSRCSNFMSRHSGRCSSSYSSIIMIRTLLMSRRMPVGRSRIPSTHEYE